MLGKLLKYEFAATSKILPVSYIATAVLLLLGWGIKSIFKDAAFAYVSLILFIVLSIIFIFIFTYVVIITRFHHSMFGNEGYLNQTLPVKKSILLISRIIVFLTWYIVSIAVIIISIICFVTIISGDWHSVWDSIKLSFGNNVTMYIFLLAAVVIQSLLFGFTVFFSISLANTSKFIKNNVAFSFVFYIISYVICSIIDVATMALIPLSIRLDTLTGEPTIVKHNMISWMIDLIAEKPEAMSVQYIGIGSVFIDILLIVAFFLLTNWLIKGKTNVK